MPILEVCSTLAFSADDIGIDPRDGGFQRAGCAAARGYRRHQMLDWRSPARRPARPQPPPAPPPPPSPRSGACRTALPRLGFRLRPASSCPGAVAGRHDHELAGHARRFRLGGIDLGRFDFERLDLRASTLGALQPWAASTFGASPRCQLGRVSSCSARAAADSTSAAAVSGRCADMSEAAGPAPTEPVSPLVGSACSLTSNSPEWVDHLVTFIACEIVTGRGLTEILGSHPGRFSAASRRPRGRRSMPPCACCLRQSRVRAVCAGRFPD